MAFRQNTNITPYWESVKKIIKESDIVLEVLDSRLPELSRNPQLEKMIKEVGRPMIYVINKADLISREALDISLDNLKEETGNPVTFVSVKKKATIRNLLAQIKKVFEKYGKPEKDVYNKFTPKSVRHQRVAKGDIIVGVLGYPNVGKSSIINSLAFKKKAKVSNVAGTTHGAHWIKASEEIKLIDTPGVIPLQYNDELRLGLIGSKNPEKLKDIDMVAMKIIEMFLEKNKKALEKKYNVEINQELNSYEVLEEIAKIKGHLKKGGVADETRTSTMIVRDWQNGELKL